MPDMSEPQPNEPDGWGPAKPGARNLGPAILFVVGLPCAGLALMVADAVVQSLLSYG
jgi:hypothetical protein